jgi:hypothetical protein
MIDCFFMVVRLILQLKDNPNALLREEPDLPRMLFCTNRERLHDLQP